MSAIAEEPEIFQRHRLSVADFHRMGEAGIFREDDRVELIEGEIVDMAPIGTMHAAAVTRLSHLFTLAVNGTAIVRSQNPVALDDRSEPEPDLVLLKPREDYYASAHPCAEDVLLLIEVADSSLRYDREIKLRLYARHGIPEVWVVDLAGRQLGVHRTPSGEDYLETGIAVSLEAMRPERLPDICLDLRGLF